VLLCSITVEQCASNPCLNDATCTEDVINQSYKCTCPPGFTGDRCQSGRSTTFITHCNIIQAGFQAHCRHYWCLWCVTALHCYSSPCLNQGSCSEDIDNKSYTCTCPPSFTGTRCESGQYMYVQCSEKDAHLAYIRLFCFPVCDKF